MSFDDQGSGPAEPPRSGPRRPGGPARPGEPRPSAAGPAGRPPRRLPPVDSAPAPAPEPAPPRRRRRDEEDDDGYFDMGHESRVPRWLVTLLVLGGIVVVIVGGSLWWYRNQVDPPGGPGETVQVQVPEGASTSKVASILDDQGVITSATVFNFYVGGKDLRTVQAGTYEFQANSSFDDAIAVLNAGPSKPASKAVTKVTIPEGYTVRQIIDRISAKVPRLKAADLQAALDSGKVTSTLKPADQPSWEGLLFPATYEIADDDSAIDVMSRMAAEMETRVQALGLEDAQAHIKQQWGLDLSAYDLLKVASMIQYEAAVPADAPKIGAVTYNRLEKGMPLQYDSTSIYEAGLQGKGPDEVDYDADTPFNTRTNTGLPPTPIAAPGEYALGGAMQPADGPWIYFVLTDTNVVSFSTDYDQFLADKQQCIDKGLGCG